MLPKSNMQLPQTTSRQTKGAVLDDEDRNVDRGPEHGAQASDPGDLADWLSDYAVALGDMHQRGEL